MRISDWSSDVCSSDLPHPRFRIDRLADAAEQPQFRQIVLLRPFVAEFHQRANRGWRRIENRHAMVLADLPEASGIRHRRRAFVHQHRRATSERTVADVAVRSEEHTSELQSLMRISYAVFCLKK